MLFRVPLNLSNLGQHIPTFVQLMGRAKWERREDWVVGQARGSPYESKIAQSYHWLELELARLRQRRKVLGRLWAKDEGAQTYPALNFAAMVVEVHSRLSRRGKTNLEGRLRDALQADVGFAPLFIEFSIASRLMVNGFDVVFPDLEGVGSVDLLFKQNSVEGEIECKSLSADAGRKIHPKAF